MKDTNDVTVNIINEEPIRPGIYIKLFNGRLSTEEELDGRGIEGPVFGPYPCFHTTFGDNLKFDPTRGLCISLVENMVYYDGVYYSDWSVFTERELVADGLDVSGRFTVFDPLKANPMTDPKASTGYPRTLPDDPENMNEERASWVECALGSFMQETSCDTPEAMKDLLVNFMHLLDRDRDYIEGWYLNGERNLIADVLSGYDEETGGTGRCPVFGDPRLVSFAREVLRILTEEEEWDSGTLDRISGTAEQEGLAKLDDSGFFKAADWILG